jgi:WD40 repeat protein
VDTLDKHRDSVNLVVFDSKNPTILATCSSDKTAILWQVSPSNSKATCVIVLKGHSDWVLFAEFHKKEPILATGSRDMSVRLWHVPPDCSKAFCMATLDGQGCSVNSLAFHNEALLLAITSNKGAKLLRISSNGSTAICVATLGMDDRGTVSSIAFDPREPHVVTGSNYDGTIKRYPL